MESPIEQLEAEARTPKSSPKPQRQIPTDERISGFAFFPDGDEMALVSENEVAMRVRALDGRSVGLPVNATAIVTSRDGRWLAGGHIDGKLTIWDRKTEKEIIQTWEQHSKDITALDFSPDSSKVASGAEDGSVILWSRVSAKRLGELIHLGAGVVRFLQFSPSGDRLAGCHYAEDGAVYVWDVSHNQLTLLFKVACAWVHKLRWLNDEKQIIAGSTTLTGVIKASTGTMILQPFGFSDVASNGKFIASFAWNVGVRFLDAVTYNEIGPVLACSGFSLSPDDCLFATEPLEDTVGPLSVWSMRDILPKIYTIALLQVSDAALVAWYEGRLVHAEATLSEEIAHQSESAHHAFANRALVRARLGDWDASLEDARTSMRIRPSVVARVAKGIALSGNEQHTRARHELDLALRDCRSHERDLILLIKCILVFKSGLHEEALERVSELTELAADKRLHTFVQAYMYQLFAEEAMTDKKYEVAIKVLTTAQDLGPFGKVPGIDTISLLFGWEYDHLWFTIHRIKCHCLLSVHRMEEATESLKAMADEFGNSLMEKDERFVAIKRQCGKTTERLGDTAMQAKNYDEAVRHYSVALDFDPPSRQDILIKRSKAQAAAKSWGESLKDAEEAIKLKPSSPWGYESRHAALHGAQRYDEALEASRRMHEQIDKSPDAKLRDQLSKTHARSHETRAAIDAVRREIFKKSPFVLIDVNTGRLCDVRARQKIFEDDPSYKELVSSMRAKPERIETTVAEFFEYVMFSHRWDEEHQEPSFQDLSDKSVWDLPPSPTIDKLRKFLEIARKAGYRFAWSDTCCINKLDPHLLAESITSMFKWYGGSALTVVFLASVPSPSKPGDLKNSVWMTRGWTLQELLSPKEIRFYDQRWNFYLNDPLPNHKNSPAIIKELAAMMGVDDMTLIDFQVSALGVREKLRLASMRVTMKEEDIAYSLIGIFASDLAPKYGEGRNALGRLLQEIVGRMCDVTVLAWTGKPSCFNSCLPDDIAVYQQSPTIPSIPADQMEKQVAKLRSSVPRDSAASIYEKIAHLPSPRFSDRRLSLPCIQFPVTELSMKTFSLKTVTRRLGGTETAYSLKVPGIGAVTITTADPLPIKPLGRLLLVHPWIRDLLDPVVDGDDWDDDPEPEDVFQSAPVPSAPSYSHEHALRVIARLGQRFSALLLQRVSHHEYQRVAADNEIIVQLPQTVSSKDIRVGVVDIL